MHKIKGYILEVFNNTDKIVKDDLEKTIKKGSKLSIAAANFSIYAFQELKTQLENIEELRFIFTSPLLLLIKVKNKKESFIFLN